MQLTQDTAISGRLRAAAERGKEGKPNGAFFKTELEEKELELFLVLNT